MNGRESNVTVPTSEFECVEIRYGFRWGPMRVVRMISDPKYGVMIAVQGKREQIEIRITPAGNKIVVDRAPKIEFSDKSTETKIAGYIKYG